MKGVWLFNPIGIEIAYPDCIAMILIYFLYDLRPKAYLAELSQGDFLL